MMSIVTQLSNLPTDDDGMVLVPPELIESIRSILSKPPARKTKKTKDPLAPKRPMNPYMRWLGDNRSSIKDSLGADAKPKDVLRAAGEQWKLLDVDVRKPFEEAYEADKIRYAKEMESYSPSPPSDEEDYNPEDFPEAPEQWNGPEMWMYMTKCVKGPDGKAIKFQDFEAAIVAANEIEECGGITKTSTGYSLRIGPKPRPNPSHSSSGMASWVKSSMTVESKPMVYPNEDEIFDTTTDEEDTEKVEKPKEAEKPKKKSFKPKEPEPEPEEESDEEEVGVEEVKINGKMYYKDDDGLVYDPDSGEVVGKYEDGKFVEN